MHRNNPPLTTAQTDPLDDFPDACPSCKKEGLWNDDFGPGKWCCHHCGAALLPDSNAEEPIDFSGIKLVMVKTEDLARLHQQLRSAKARIKSLEGKAGVFFGMSTEQIKQVKSDLEKTIEDLAFEKQKVRNLTAVIAARDEYADKLKKEVVDLKAKLYDKYDIPSCDKGN